MKRVEPIAVIGAGSWGTALAILLANNGAPVRLWGRDPQQMAAMAQERLNRRYLPDSPLPDGLTPTGELREAVEGVQDLLLTVPSHAFRDNLRSLKPMLHPQVRLSWASKGLEPGSRKFIHEMVREELGNIPVAVVSGPTFAREVAHGLPTAVTVAGSDEAIATHFAERLHGHNFRPYTSSDLVGVELGGATKNVLALAAGIADGLGFGANTRSALITRGLAEMMRLGVAVGGQRETFMGLAGLGDLVLTCTDDQSRNRRVGLALGKGSSLEQAIASVGQAVEGVKSAPEILRLSGEHGVEMPITEQVVAVLKEGRSPQAAVEALLAREPKPETI
jgi:glycerol-3-phosphate dehydrogenase (NAD(P)+)